MFLKFVKPVDISSCRNDIFVSSSIADNKSIHVVIVLLIVKIKSIPCQSLCDILKIVTYFYVVNIFFFSLNVKPSNFLF